MLLSRHFSASLQLTVHLHTLYTLLHKHKTAARSIVRTRSAFNTVYSQPIVMAINRIASYVAWKTNIEDMMERMTFPTKTLQFITRYLSSWKTDGTCDEDSRTVRRRLGGLVVRPSVDLTRRQTHAANRPTFTLRADTHPDTWQHVVYLSVNKHFGHQTEWFRKNTVTISMFLSFS